MESSCRFLINYYALFITLAVILIMAFWPRKVQKYFPSSLFVIILFLIVNMVFRLPVAVVGEIPRTLLPESRLILSKVDFSNFTAYLSPAFSIAVLGMVESLLCGASAGKMKGEKLDAGQELFAQGIGNMNIPFFGGVPATAAIARTSVAIKSGGQTRLVSVFHSLGLLASMLLLAPYMAMIPLSALGGVLMVTAFRMNEWQEIRIIFKKKLKTSMAQFLITLIATVLLDLTSAILLGVGVSMVIMVVRLRSEVHVTIDETENESIFVMNVSGALFFACQDTMEKMVLKLYERGAKVIILNLAGVTFLDHSEAEEFEEIYREMTRNGVRIIFAGMSKEVHTMFSRVGFYDEISQEDKKSSIMEALKDIDLVKKN